MNDNISEELEKKVIILFILFNGVISPAWKNSITLWFLLFISEEE